MRTFIRAGLSAAFILAAALHGSPMPPAAAQTADNPAPVEPAAPNPQPWTIACSGQGPQGALVCQMSQGLIAKNTGQRVVTMTIFKAQGAGYTATLALPHGLLLPEGVQTWVDEGQRATHPIRTADQNGSYATVPLDDAIIGAMKKGSIYNILVKSAAGDEVIFQLSLNGFTAALAKI